MSLFERGKPGPPPAARSSGVHGTTAKRQMEVAPGGDKATART